MHDGSTFVVFDVTHPCGLFERYVLCKALFLEIADRVVVSIREEMLNRRGRFHVVFEMRHEVCAVALNLLIGGYGAEDDLRKFTSVERAVSDSSAETSV